MILLAACSREAPAPPASTSSASPAADPSAVSTAAGTPVESARAGTYDEGMIWLKSAAGFAFVFEEPGLRAEGSMTRKTVGQEQVTFKANNEEWRAGSGTKGITWEKKDGAQWKAVDAPPYGNRLYQRITLAIDPQKKEGAAQLAGNEAGANHYRFTNANSGEVHDVWIDANSRVTKMQIGEGTRIEFREPK